MASLLDMALGHFGLQNPLAPNPQAGQNPYVIASQLAATPPTQPNPNYAQVGPNQPGVQPTQPNPQYAQLQQQEQQALADQTARDRSQAMFGMAAGMLGARNPYGGPAGFGQALGAGITGGQQSYAQSQELANQRGRAMLEAQNVGRQGALAQQQLQKGQYELDDEAKFRQTFGFADPNMAKFQVGRMQASQQAAMLQQYLDTNAVTPETRMRAMNEMAMLSSGTPDPDMADHIFGKALSPVEERLKNAQAGAANARIGASEAYAANMRSTGAMNKYGAETQRILNAARAKGTIAKTLGIGPTSYAFDAIEKQLAGMPDPDIPTKAGVDQKMHMHGHPPLKIGDNIKINGINWLWDGRVFIPTDEGLLSETEPAAGTPPPGSYPPEE